MAKLPRYRFEALHAQDGGPTCIGPIAAMPWLKSLSVGGGPLPLDLSRHVELESLSLEWHPKLHLPPKMPELRLMQIWKYKHPINDLSWFPELPKIEHLVLIQGNIQRLTGLSRFPTLLCLELHYIPSLADVSEIGALPHLQEIRIQKCPNVVDLSGLSACTQARVVWIEGIRSLPSIQFARSMPNLERLGVMKSNVIDGDLSPGDAVPNFFHDNRPHYNRKQKRERMTLKPA